MYTTCKSNIILDDYRFGFNGQEKEDEVHGEGNLNYAQYWMYDTRLGRRWNIDPVDQISISNYSVMGDNPIKNFDKYGDDWYIDEDLRELWWYEGNTMPQSKINELGLVKLGDDYLFGITALFEVKKDGATNKKMSKQESEAFAK